MVNLCMCMWMFLSICVDVCLYVQYVMDACICVCVYISIQYSEMVYVYMSEIYHCMQRKKLSSIHVCARMCVYVCMHVCTQYTQMVYTNKKLSCISTHYGEQIGINETLLAFLGSVIPYT